MDWKVVQISEDGTHHVMHGQPVYGTRFNEVLAFHAPGLAPVRKNGEAWHINIKGMQVYKQRFIRTFGFYERLAAVISADGWHHINPTGDDAYLDRYAWCGNFQEGCCTVRDEENNYFHITESGTPLYADRWNYAGDFRDGFAVVQASHGRSTHINGKGHLVHGCWFLDLDVFHKGFARARDEDGWMHIDRTGSPAHRRRFASVEPFYNGQARVERFDGGLEIFNEHGERIVELRPALRSEFAALSSDLVGFWRTQTICTAVEVGLFDVLPGTSGELANRCSLNHDGTCRLLRALDELLLVERRGNNWHATDRGDYLRQDAPLTLADAAIEYGRYFGKYWAKLPQALCDGSDWTPPDVFGDVAIDQRRIFGHHRMLRSYARHDYTALPESLGFRGDETVIDAGGGLGTIAAGLLQRHPDLRVTVLDRPEVVASMSAPMEYANRFEAIAADLFEPWPVKGNVVILARVLHDWDDEKAEIILRNAHMTLLKSGHLFIVEMPLPVDGHSGGLCDLHLLAVTGGKERTVAEYGKLLERCGFIMEEVRELQALPSIIVGVAQ